jgi:hypothetical protein
MTPHAVKQHPLAQLFQLSRTEPLKAAVEIERVANRLLAVAAQLRQQEAERTRSTGGGLDRVQMVVMGPDGEGRMGVKQAVDTGEVT